MIFCAKLSTSTTPTEPAMLIRTASFEFEITRVSLYLRINRRDWFVSRAW
jgi:hypothetical protein